MSFILILLLENQIGFISPSVFLNKSYIFHAFRISSDNNSRKYNGTTYIETNDLHVQRINLLDIPQRNGTYEVEFSDVELKSTDTFCKETKTIERKRNKIIIDKILDSMCGLITICSMRICLFIFRFW